MGENFSENWFGVIKNTWEGKPPPNAGSLYSYKEIQEMFEKKKYYEKVYGYYPIEYIGNLEAFNNLKGDYSRSGNFLYYSENALYNFSITQISFILKIMGGWETKQVRFNIELRISSTGSSISINFLRNAEITKKMFKDFVDIYNMPNNKYKNMYAIITEGHVKTLEYLFSKDDIYNSYDIENGPEVFEILRELKL